MNTYRKLIGQDMNGGIKKLLALILVFQLAQVALLFWMVLHIQLTMR